MKKLHIFIGGKHTKWWKNIKTFVFNGKEYKMFCHRVNCGWPPFRMTERSVELSLSDEWLEARDNVIEIGAATPYYWPHRVRDIVDPADTHKLVNIKKTLFDVDLTGKNVLSISTLEHIGSGEYGLEKQPQAAFLALEKIVKESQHAFITIPAGYNPALDDYVLKRPQKDIKVFFLARGKGKTDNDWRQAVELVGHQRQYGDTANGLIVITK